MIKIVVTTVVVVVLTVFTIITVQNNYPNEDISLNQRPIDVSNENSPKEVEGIPTQSNSDTTSEVVIPNVSKSNILDLSGKNITKAPMYIFGKTEIEELNLSDNNLDGALQAEVRHLQNLKILDLSNNQFTGVPAEIGQLKNLEVLDLSNNKLIGLPYELGNLSNLKLLNLKGNNYSTADLDIIKVKLSKTTVIEVD